MRNGTEMRHAAGVATTAQTAVPPIRVEAGLDRLLGHADAPLDTRNVHVLTLAVVANIRDRAARLGHLDRVLERDIRPQCLNRRIDSATTCHFDDALHDVFAAGVYDNV